MTALHYSPKAAQESVYMNYTLFTHSIGFCSTVSVVPRTKTGPCCNQVKKYQLWVCIHQSQTQWHQPQTSWSTQTLSLSPGETKLTHKAKHKENSCWNRGTAAPALSPVTLVKRSPRVSQFLLCKQCCVGQQNTCRFHIPTFQPSFLRVVHWDDPNKSQTAA